MENICKFQMAFSQWRAGLRKKSFWDVFLRLASFVFMKNFRFLSPALHVLSKKMPIFYHICVKKYFSTKIFTVLHQSKKELLDLEQNWAKTRHLLLKTWKSSISMDSPIVHWSYDCLLASTSRQKAIKGWITRVSYFLVKFKIPKWSRILQRLLFRHFYLW